MWKEWKGECLYLLPCRVRSILAVIRAGEGVTVCGRGRLSLLLSVLPSCWGFHQAVDLLHKRLEVCVQGLEPAGQSSHQRPVYQIRQLRNLGNKNISTVKLLLGGLLRKWKWTLRVEAGFLRNIFWRVTWRYGVSGRTSTWLWGLFRSSGSAASLQQALWQEDEDVWRQLDSGEVRSCIAVETKRAWSLMASRTLWSLCPRHSWSGAVGSATLSGCFLRSLSSRVLFSPPTGSLRWDGLCTGKTAESDLLNYSGDYREKWALLSSNAISH